MPPIAVRDLEIQRRESDLVVGTFGRGIYILDDYSPLRHLTARAAGQAECDPARQEGPAVCAGRALWPEEKKRSRVRASTPPPTLRSERRSLIT